MTSPVWGVRFVLTWTIGRLAACHCRQSRMRPRERHCVVGGRDGVWVSMVNPVLSICRTYKSVRQFVTGMKRDKATQAFTFDPVPGKQWEDAKTNLAHPLG